MAKDFLQAIDNSYTIPSQILIGSGNEPTDLRQTCDTVDDFQDIADLGMELRYDGLVTYEMTTGLWKGCREKEGAFEWVTLNQDIMSELTNYAKKDHKHKEYLPEVSDQEPEISMPQGHVWIESMQK